MSIVKPSENLNGLVSKVNLIPNLPWIHTRHKSEAKIKTKQNPIYLDILGTFKSTFLLGSANVLQLYGINITCKRPK